MRKAFGNMNESCSISSESLTTLQSWEVSLALGGMRVTVGTIMGLLASGQFSEQILASYPYPEPDDVRAALAYAAWRTQETELPLP